MHKYNVYTWNIGKQSFQVYHKTEHYNKIVTINRFFKANKKD